MAVFLLKHYREKVIVIHNFSYINIVRILEKSIQVFEFALKKVREDCFISNNIFFTVFLTYVNFFYIKVPLLKKMNYHIKLYYISSIQLFGM